MDYKKPMAVLLGIYLVLGMATAQTSYLGNDTHGLKGFMKEMVEFLPILMDLAVVVVPLIILFAFVGWITGLLDGILDMLNLTALKRGKK